MPRTVCSSFVTMASLSLVAMRSSSLSAAVLFRAWSTSRSAPIGHPVT
jgi:hypothetical protein